MPFDVLITLGAERDLANRLAVRNAGLYLFARTGINVC